MNRLFPFEAAILITFCVIVNIKSFAKIHCKNGSADIHSFGGGSYKYINKQKLVAMGSKAVINCDRS